MIDKNLSVNKINNKNVKDRSDDLTFSSGLTSTFKLGLPSKFKSDLPEIYDLDLSSYFEKPEKMFNKMKKGYTKKEIDFSKYLSSDFQSLRPLKSSPSFRRFKSGTARPQGRVSFQSKDYDITPWANKVVDRIQKNWLISPPQEISEKGEVGISVIIEKNGELSSINMVNSSMVPLFDQAALRALDLSSPFPELPDDFPDKNLEAYFVFQYND